MNLIKKKKPTKSEVILGVKNFAFIVIGCVLLAVADAVFLVPGRIISGGISSVAIIVDYFVQQTYPGFDSVDITVSVIQWVLFFIGLAFLGKKFSFHTLVASVVYPVVLSLLYRLDFLTSDVTHQLFTYALNAKGIMSTETTPAANLLLAGIFGGALAGAGVAITFLGNGSTGGFDIVSFIIAKYTDIKQGISSFAIDGTIIIVGMICMNNIVVGLIGILSAFVCAVMIQYIYVNTNTFIIADIISVHYKEIMNYIHVNMGHGTTLIDTVGGYTGEDRKLIRVAFNKIETSELRNYIAKVDPTAFVTFTQAQTINGEGFIPFSTGKKTINAPSLGKPDVLTPDASENTDASKSDSADSKNRGK